MLPNHCNVLVKRSILILRSIVKVWSVIYNEHNLLQLQPEGSFERKIVAGSKKSLADLTNFVNTITQQL